MAAAIIHLTIYRRRRARRAIPIRLAATQAAPPPAPVPTAPGRCRWCGGPIALYPEYAAIYTLDKLAADATCARCYVPF